MLVDLESAVAEELEIIVKVAARYAHLVAEPLNGVGAVLGEQLQQIQLALKFVMSHGVCLSV